MSKKITITHIISSLKIGGAEALLHRVLYFHEGPYRNKIEALGIKTEQINGLICLYDPVFFWRLYKTIKKINPHVIHSSLWAANFCGRLVARVLSIPIVCAVHLGPDQDGFIRNMLDKFTLFYATKIVAVSQTVKESLSRKNWFPAKRIVAIPNGINQQRVLANAAQYAIQRSDLEIYSGTFVIGAVGRLISRKNFSMLISALATLAQDYNHIQLVLVGAGPEEKALKATKYYLSWISKKQYAIIHYLIALYYRRTLKGFLLLF
jgi:glycosyltransferase involved in cell wall biosynthesis